MIFGKAIIWTARMLLVGLFVAFLFVISTGFSESVAQTHQLQMQKLHFDIMPVVINGGVIDASVFNPNFLTELLGEQSKIGFVYRLIQDEAVVKESYYNEQYYTSRIYLTTGGSYYEYTGSFPVMFEDEEVDFFYSYVVAR